ncbi:aldehyde dehydrogenase family protein [Paraburkholderia sp. 35.1]|uniref:aldehyde dehydrogenase family protein n=1 Tax=Paraburkholderia sp. 35.1 TaxID=2991058 RepID=UPI003D1E95C5
MRGRRSFVRSFSDSFRYRRRGNGAWQPDQYGLGGAVWTKTISTALRVVKWIYTEMMWVNCYGLIDPPVGLGGTKHSGYGAEGGRAHLETYPYNKCVYINR